MSFLQVTLELLQGFKTTCLIFSVTLAASLPLGLVVCLGSMSRFAPLRWLTRTFIWVIRGTPLMLQVLVVFYVPGLAFGMPMHNRLAAVLAAFIINYAAYFSEIYRGGIKGHSPRASGRPGRCWHDPRPDLGASCCCRSPSASFPHEQRDHALVKDTSLARVIAVGELIRAAQDIAAQRALVWPLFYTGVFYLAFSGLFDPSVRLGRKETKLLQGVTGMEILEVKGLCKRFGGLEVLNGIDLTLDQGQVLAIIGSSGSGKTTLLRCLNFSRTPGRGRIVRGRAGTLGPACTGLCASAGCTSGWCSKISTSSRSIPCCATSPLQWIFWQKSGGELAARQAAAENEQKPGSCWAGWAWPTSCRTTPSSFRAGQQRVAIARALALSRISSASTNPPAPWTLSSLARCCGSSAA